MVSPKTIQPDWRFKAKCVLKNTVKHLLQSLGVTLERYHKVFLRHPEARFEVTFEWLLNHYWLASKENFFFVQIGANDGVGDDPIHHFIKTRHPRGILVEPQPDCIEALRKVYEGESQLIIEQCVIGEKAGVLPFYTSHFSRETTLVASLDYDVVLQSLRDWRIPSPESHIEITEVTMHRLDELLSKHGVGKIDLLQVDAEGYDFEIIKTIDFKLLKPAIISYEHRHLTQIDKDACWDLLIDQGYMLWMNGPDTVALNVGEGYKSEVKRVL